MNGMAKEDDYEYSFSVYRMPINTAFNTDNLLKDEFYVGNYLDKYRPKNKKISVYSTKDFLQKWSF